MFSKLHSFTLNIIFQCPLNSRSRQYILLSPHKFSHASRRALGPTGKKPLLRRRRFDKTIIGKKTIKLKVSASLCTCMSTCHVQSKSMNLAVKLSPSSKCSLANKELRLVNRQEHLLHIRGSQWGYLQLTVKLNYINFLLADG